MHYHNVQQAPDDGLLTFCDELHTPLSDLEDGLAYQCDCERSVTCVFCEDEAELREDAEIYEVIEMNALKIRYSEFCSICGCDPSEHNWETHALEMRAG
jgi:hypothetical protein